MITKFNFTYENLIKQYKVAIENNYSIITCEDFAKKYWLTNTPPKTNILINRVDIDFSIKKARKLGEIFNELGIKGSFFLRLHAPEYNPFSFENYRVIKFLIDSGHEIGYHSEIVDQSVIWDENIEDCLSRDIQTLNSMFNIQVKGVASHGGMTGLNNLDFWNKHDAAEFGLLYEAYDWFNDVFYVSDSEWTQWKCYNKGKLVEGDTRSFENHLIDKYPQIYLLIHPETYYINHFYE